ncbi:hypothetical protein RhiirC2_801078, partial [Rhizophagus irregularis]
MKSIPLIISVSINCGLKISSKVEGSELLLDSKILISLIILADISHKSFISSSTSILSLKRNKKNIEIKESEEEVEKENDNSDDSEKIGEILSLEDKEWNENIENINEEEIENVINTEGFGLSQNSDSNDSLKIKDSDNESELSDYNLQGLFQENILLNMATVDEIRGLLRTYMQNQYGNDLGADLGNANPNLVNNALGNINATRGLVVEFPLFGGSENEDAEEW